MAYFTGAPPPVDLAHSARTAHHRVAAGGRTACLCSAGSAASTAGKRRPLSASSWSWGRATHSCSSSRCVCSLHVPCQSGTRSYQSLCDLDAVLRPQPRALTAARLGVGACIWDGALVLAAWAAAQPAGTFAGADHSHQAKHTGSHCGACSDYAVLVREVDPPGLWQAPVGHGQAGAGGCGLERAWAYVASLHGWHPSQACSTHQTAGPD